MSRATGAEMLRCRNGSTMTLLSTEESSQHGETIDLAVLDEAWCLSSSAEQSTRPAMLTRPAAQLWCTSTAGPSAVRSPFWWDKVQAGRTNAELGVTEGTAYFEWSPGEGVDVTDPDTWPTFMPALNVTIPADVVAADLASMDLAEWRRACCNMWSDEADDSGWRIIPKDLWEQSRL
jgi:phage terminase large subunit-like protein